MSELALIGDIGGTNARFALHDGDRWRDTATLPSSAFGSLEAAVEAYLAGALAATGAARPWRGCLAVAGPVADGVVRVTNLPWVVSIEEARTRLHFETLTVVNDFVAQALATPRLEADALRCLGGGAAVAHGPIAVIGAGSGLGVASLAWSDGGWVALASEGGHATAAAADEREEAILALLRHRFGHVSWERVASGAGLVNLYEALVALGGGEAMPHTPAQIGSAALAGTDPAALAAVESLCAFLGTAAGNLALTVGATGGTFVAGGLAPRLLPILERSLFRERFEAKGRLRPWLEAVPTHVVTHPLPAFVGLGALLGKARTS